jgi:TetR/AcrR family acrAB operon transcriptional repressor
LRRTKAEAEETRRGILAAAERLFHAKGLAATSLEEIAAEAGVTRGAVYWHFANKADLVVALFEDAPLFHEDLLALLSEDDPAGPLGALEAMVIAALERLATDERRQRIYSLVALGDQGELMSRVMERKSSMMEDVRLQLAVAFVKADERGQIALPWTGATAADAFDWLLHGVIMDWLKFGRRFDLASRGAEVFRLQFHCFRGGEPRRT